MSKTPKLRNSSGVDLSRIDLARRYAFETIADFFERSPWPSIHLSPASVSIASPAGCISPSQAVSIARALRPYAAQEARRRRAHGLTAPGLRRKATSSNKFSSREFVARCVGLAPATLRKAEMVVAAAEHNRRLSHCVMVMDESGIGIAFRVITGERSLRFPTSVAAASADRKFGERFLKHLLAAPRSGSKDAERCSSKKGRFPDRELERSTIAARRGRRP
jgi:hypothetical protein